MQKLWDRPPKSTRGGETMRKLATKPILSKGTRNVFKIRRVFMGKKAGPHCVLSIILILGRSRDT